MGSKELGGIDQRQADPLFCGRGFYAFLFETKEDKDLIFRNGPYFFGSRGMFLNRWTLDY
jgi:hypothetical protein